MTRATTFRVAAVFSGFLIAILMIMTASRAVFTDPTSNDGNAVAAGTVVLNNVGVPNNTDSGIGDGTGDPMFDTPGSGTYTVDASDMAPGDGGVVNCIEIEYSGTVASTIELTSVTVGTDTASMAAVLDLTIDRYTSTDCTGTVDAAVYSGTLAAWADAETAWSASATASRSYEVTIELQSTAGNPYQGATTSGIDFEWTATSS
ncbi:MAG: hypothetical protein BMS9Abin07_2033 [Acidimicrobiia bacterium]|nr:MAG: hypothetical protein BMS9Abin07_2033 [Acidimicrobiia bacterium]